MDAIDADPTTPAWTRPELVDLGSVGDAANSFTFATDAVFGEDLSP